MPLICGIDEAGRGPVLGPMVFAGISIEEKDMEKLKELGVKDSKLLSAKRREELFGQIQQLVHDYCIVALPPKRIDAAVESESSSLNRLGSHASANIIRFLQPQTAVLDCPSTNIPAYTKEMRALVGDGPALIVEHKADVNHVVVGAASILAKVTRDRVIEQIEEMVGSPIGSGYPADPVTIKFLEENWDRYEFFRRSWNTWKRLAQSKQQKTLGNF